MTDLPPAGHHGSFYLFDAPGWIHKFIHAAGDKAASIFVERVTSLIKKRRPTYIAVAYDCVGPTVRHEIYPAYKGNRKRTAEEDKIIKEQLELSENALRELNVPILKADKHEAEDSIATALMLKGWSNAVIMGTDKDLKCLICDNVIMWDFKTVTGTGEVFKRYEVYPNQMQSYLAMVGDVSDNIPGIPRVGEKYASDILSEHKTLGRAMNASLFSPSLYYATKYAKWLRYGIDKARLSLQLVKLRVDAPISVTSINDLRTPSIGPTLAKVFDRVGNRQ